MASWDGISVFVEGVDFPPLAPMTTTVTLHARHICCGAWTDRGRDGSQKKSREQECSQMMMGREAFSIHHLSSIATEN